MTEQMKRLEIFFRQKDVNFDKDDCNDNSFGEYWEFINPEDVEDWSIELVPMMDYTYFVHKFKNLPIALPISHEEKVKEVLSYSKGILLIHYKTIGPKEYMFTMCVEYIKASFYMPIFPKSLENSKYESLFKEVES
jgi:hypothetical protein